MTTPIHTTKKLEKLIRKIVQPKLSEDELSIFGKWNATVFYVDRKKCWLFSNARTQYVVILTNVKASELGKIESLFKNAFYSQLVYDGIINDFENIDTLLGTIEFLPTDNDKRTTGFQNQRIQDLKLWQYQFGKLEDMPMKELCSRMNQMPIHLGPERRTSDYTTATKAMNILLSI